jgi:hypothetical protein
VGGERSREAGIPKPFNVIMLHDVFKGVSHHAHQSAFSTPFIVVGMTKYLMKRSGHIRKMLFITIYPHKIGEYYKSPKKETEYKSLREGYAI